MEIVEKKLKIEIPELVSLLGLNEPYLDLIQKRFKTAVILRGENVILKGHTEEIKLIERIFKEFEYIYSKNGALSKADVNTVIDLIDINHKEDLSADASNNPNPIIYNGVKDLIRVKSPKQYEYLQKVMTNDLVFSVGPAGTGKTFLAVAMALAALRRNEVAKIIITRPAVEAGESLGFLPGDMREKIDPYLRPLTDALQLMLGVEKLKALMEKQIIEITPLAYMRGRTLNNAFIILDEAQNATIVQMKMFLTRLGANSRAVITGDVTQIDLQDSRQSGLIHAKNILQNIKGIEFVMFDNKDVVRHKLVAHIINAYEKDNDQKIKAKREREERMNEYETISNNKNAKTKTKHEVASE